MHLFRNIPLKHKLTMISMVTSGAALLLTCGVIAGYEMISFRKAMVKQGLMTAKMIGDNSAAALTFGDPESAAQTLHSLSADPHVVAAFIYDAEGTPFARYQPAGASPLTAPPVEKNLTRFTDDYLELFHDGFGDDYLEQSLDIVVAGESIGTVYLRHDMIELRDNLGRFGYLILGVVGAVSLVALVLTRQLQPLVSRPITDLAEVVREVAANKDFSVRAVKQGNDEVGRLIDGFNEMLSQIQHRDSALQAAQDGLEIRVEERTRDLANSFSVLNATLESTADGILAVQLSGKVLCYNRQFAEMWGISAEVLEKKDGMAIASFLAAKVRDPEKYLEGINQQRGSLNLESFDVIELNDGRTFERYVRAQQVDGRLVGVVINNRDITERTQAERRVAELNRRLVETSRQAGMAEVASSVLHNVGNVLNSVNVSMGIASARAGKLKSASLGRIATLLREHAGDLPGFFASHPQGRQLPAFLSQLAEHFAAEQQTLLAELGSLQTNVEHINEIVAMQQSHAGAGGLIETLSLADVIDDAVRMNAAALNRYGVEVIRELDPTLPSFEADRHKILLILVNLIRNANYACHDSGCPDQRITMRAELNGGGMARIAVSDTGVGIPPENLTRIFEHGFTTRASGHGFGLHSSALAASDMGGSLRVQSDGTGRGASFILEIPCHPGAPNS